MALTRISKGLPYSAVLALLGWLMLSQGHPPTVTDLPQTSALQRAEPASVEECEEPAAPAAADDVLRVLPAVPPGTFELRCSDALGGEPR